MSGPRRSKRPRRTPARFGSDLVKDSDPPAPPALPIPGLSPVFPSSPVESVDRGSQTFEEFITVEEAASIRAELKRVLVRLVDHCTALAQSELLRAVAERGRLKLMLEIEKLNQS